jgi:ferredoxin
MLKDKKAFIKNKDNCMECGACEKNCPEGAISVRSGVGCAAGIIQGLLNNSEPTCDCSCEKTKCC